MDLLAASVTPPGWGLGGLPMEQREDGAGLVGGDLCVRYAVQVAVARVAAAAAEVLGGMAGVTSGEVACLLAGTGALAFHRPSRVAAAGALDIWLRGGA